MTRALTLAALLLLGVSQAWAVTEFWVGDGGDAAAGCPACTHWSLTSGGSPGAPPPDATVDCRFDAASFTLAGQTATTSAALFCKSLNTTGVLHAPTLNNDSEFDIYGSLNLTDMTLTTTGTAPLNVLGDNGGGTITPAGNTFVSFSLQDAGTWDLAGDLLVTACSNSWAATIVNTNNHNVSGCEVDTRNAGQTVNAGTTLFTVNHWYANVAGNMLNMGSAEVRMPYTIGNAGFFRCWPDQTYGLVHVTSDANGADFFNGNGCTITTLTVDPGEGIQFNSVPYVITTLNFTGTALAHTAIDALSGSVFGTTPAGDYADITNSGCCIGGGCPATSTGPCYAGSHGSVDAASGGAYDPLLGVGGWLAQDAPATPTPTDTSTPTKTPTPTATSRTPSPTPTFSVVPSWTPTQTPLPSSTPLPTLTFTPNEHASYFKLACPTPPCIGTPIPADDGYKTAFFTQNAGNCTQGVYCQAPHAKATPVQVQCLQGYTTVAGNGQCDFNTTCAEAYCAVETGGDASCVASCWIERWKGWTQVH